MNLAAEQTSCTWLATMDGLLQSLGTSLIILALACPNLLCHIINLELYFYVLTFKLVSKYVE